MAPISVSTDITAINAHMANVLVAHSPSILLNVPPLNVIINVYCKDKTETSASIKFIFRNILTLK